MYLKASHSEKTNTLGGDLWAGWVHRYFEMTKWDFSTVIPKPVRLTEFRLKHSTAWDEQFLVRVIRVAVGFVISFWGRGSSYFDL